MTVIWAGYVGLHVNLVVLGVGIEPTLGPHLGHTGYKSVGASSYTNQAVKNKRPIKGPISKILYPQKDKNPLGGIKPF